MMYQFVVTQWQLVIGDTLSQAFALNTLWNKHKEDLKISFDNLDCYQREKWVSFTIETELSEGDILDIMDEAFVCYYIFPYSEIEQ